MAPFSDRPRTLDLPQIAVCGLDVAAAGTAETARALIDYCLGPERGASVRPLFATSVNGQVFSICARDARVNDLFRQADVIQCDGQPLVLLSRALGRRRFPERVATTDLFPVMARMAAEAGVSFYLLGATEEVNARAVALTRAAFPALRIVGASHGYLSAAAEREVVAEIARLKPDVLWVALGAPREQAFCVRNRDALRGVGVMKTAGGLFDFLALSKARAPRWMQDAGLEWLFRTWVEPKRLFWRYLVTNPHALYLVARSFGRERLEAERT